MVTYLTLVRRCLKRSLTRFLSITAIVAVGAGFLGGLLSTDLDMRLTVDDYYDRTGMFDIDAKCAFGLNESDIERLSALECTEDILPAFVYDLVFEKGGGSCTARIYGMDAKRSMNNVILAEGRMPEKSDECVMVLGNKYTDGYSVGDIYTVSETNGFYDTRSDIFAHDSYTVVGRVTFPYYLSIEADPSTAGKGSIDVALIALPEAFTLKVYTDAFIAVKGARELDSFSEEYKTLITAAADTINTLADTIRAEKLESTKAEAEKSLSEKRSEYEEAKAEAQEKLAAAEQSITEQEQLLAAKSAELNAAKRDFDSQKDMMPAAKRTETEAALQKAQTELEEGEAKLSAAKAALESAKKQAEEKFAQANSELESARREIDSLAAPAWYNILRTDTLSFISYSGNCDKIGAIAKVFPVFFFFVAALVALTTMTRMVEEERGQIGTLKTLGYGNASIILYYIGFSFAASVIGSVAGLLLGMKVLPAVISGTYKMMYDLPATLVPYRLKYFITIPLISVACTGLATLAACLAAIRERPAALLLPKAPKAGKKILLEHITPIWHKMSFTRKVTARNVFRYKKRLFMTVAGVAGCCALLVTGFGLRDSIHDIVDLQFGELYTHNAEITLTGDSPAENEALLDILNGDDVNSYSLIHTEKGYAGSDADTESATIVIPESREDFAREVVFRDRHTKKTFEFTANGAYLTEKLSEQIGVSTGDSFTLKAADGSEFSLTVAGICENYISAYVFVDKSLFAAASGTDPDEIKANAVFLTAASEAPEKRDELSERLLATKAVANVRFNATVRESFENTVKSIDYIVMVLIAAAGILAVIVLYNLTNINICERVKELATIKVLGFYNGEVASYIYRETAILTLIGIVCGFGFGAWLHSFVVRTAEVNAVMFGRTASIQSYLLAAAVTIVFAALVDLIMYPKLKRIDMVESMKAPE